MGVLIYAIVMTVIVILVAGKLIFEVNLCPKVISIIKSILRKILWLILALLGFLFKHKKVSIIGSLSVLSIILLINLVCVGIMLLESGKMYKSLETVHINADLEKRENKLKDCTLIALFGVDNQENDVQSANRTDTIILVSVNKRTKEIKLMQVLRDSYMTVEDQYTKINSAYSSGGKKLAVSSLNRNLDLNISEYVVVNFKAVADAVDYLGGVKLTINSEEERKELNRYIKNMNKINGGDSPVFEQSTHYPYEATFDGNQAVAFSRIRKYKGGGDGVRANRQMEIVKKLLRKAVVHPIKMTKLVCSVFSKDGAQTSLNRKEIISLIPSVLHAKTKTATTKTYPFEVDNRKLNGVYYGFPKNMTKNVKQVHAYLFDNKKYTPGEEVKKISRQVQADYKKSRE